MKGLKDMLSPEEREELKSIIRDIELTKSGPPYQSNLTFEDLEWLATKLIEEDDLSSKLSEELQTANEELARRAEFD